MTSLQDLIDQISSAWPTPLDPDAIKQEERDRLAAALVAAGYGTHATHTGVYLPAWIRAGCLMPSPTQPLREAQWEYGLAMVPIPGGSFLMGSPKEEEGRDADEGPQHEVTLQDFWLGETPITQVQWREVAGWPKVERDLAPDPSHFKGDDRPVEQVNWYEAIEFCRRLSARTGKNYTLPSEAQWEYACRAGTTTPFHFGATISTEQANYDERYAYGDGPAGKYREQTTDVASFAANAWGLHDMHGNVWEWCLDDWHDNYEGAPQDGSAWAAGEERLGKSCAADPGLARPATAARPTGAIATPTSAPTTSASASAAADQRKVLRGGSCFDKPHICRSAYRISFHPGNRDGDVGFRVCLTSNPAPAASQEAMADAREESQAAAWGDIKPEQVLPAVESLAAAIEPTPPATTPGGNLAPMLADAATLLHQSEANLATTREALRRLVVWGGLSASKAFNGAIVAGVTDWFADGMTGPLPPVWPYIVSREGVEPTPSAPALPPANTYDGGNGTVIEATNSERTSWAVRDGNLCLNFSGEWEPEPYPSSRSADFLARTRWPSAEAAWAALLAHRAANPLYSMAREAASSALLAYNRAANEAKGVQS